MDKKHYAINKYASMLNRLGNIYFDQHLEPYGFSSGQLYFLLRLSHQEGCSLFELADSGYFDKGTTTRAIQKLEELSYVYRMDDPKDKRIQRVYLSKQGEQILPAIRDILHDWERIVLADIDDATADATLQVLLQMADNARRYSKERKREQYERNHHK